METIVPGKYVEIAYDLFTVDSVGGKRTLVHTVETAEPENFIFGVTPGLVEGLVKELDGNPQGYRFDIHVPAALGFLFNPGDIVKLPIDIFLNEEGCLDTDRVKVGESLPMVTADGFQITGVVKEIAGNDVTMDFNHPLVGKDLHFAGRVLTVRDATSDELRPYFSPCGGGCCGGKGGCGNGCGGGCEDGCRGSN